VDVSKGLCDNYCAEEPQKTAQAPARAIFDPHHPTDPVGDLGTGTVVAVETVGIEEELA
jgi:hypothetical protein